MYPREYQYEDHPEAMMQRDRNALAAAEEEEQRK
jgi:hypothetical protein